MKDFFAEVAVLLSYPKNLVLLLVRLALAYGFAQPALMKLNNIKETALWFGSLSIPFPVFSAYFVTGIELTGIILLVLGLYTRIVAVLLSCVMLGAILFVHLQHGFSAADNGFEIPLYYFIFLLFLASYGAGKYSLDRVIFKDGTDE